MHQSAKQIYDLGAKWVDENPRTWEYIKDMVRRDVKIRSYQDLRISFYIEQARAYHFVKIPNSIAAYLARRLENEVRGAHFAKSKSKLDLYMKGGE